VKSGTVGTVKGHKSALPLKTCAACSRPMSWRKRWSRHWDEVKYCSRACREGRRRIASQG